MTFFYWTSDALATTPQLIVVVVNDSGIPEWQTIHSNYDLTILELLSSGAREISARTAYQFGWPA